MNQDLSKKVSVYKSLTKSNEQTNADQCRPMPITEVLRYSLNKLKGSSSWK